MPKIYYIANARMPTEKGHGIQIAKMCEAFIEKGADLTLVVPRRVTDPRSVRDYYGLRVEVPLIRLPALDWYTGGRVGYLISSLSFMLSYMLFVWQRKRAKEEFILYTVDTEAYSSSALALLGQPLFSEMHSAKINTFAQRVLFKSVKGIIAINSIIVSELKNNFPRSSARYIVEPNGIDLSEFSEMDKRDARVRLGLPQDVPTVLYLGRFFDWKGLEIVSQAAAKTPSIRWQMVGGTEADFVRLTNEPVPSNLFFAGDCPYNERTIWFAAADALLVLGTVRDIQSYRYTSPMKLFEYLAAERPIIASNTPAIREIVSEKEVLFYEPDNAHDLARIAELALIQNSESTTRVKAAKRLGDASSWHARAERILSFCSSTIEKKENV